jgi:hypothetical protein
LFCPLLTKGKQLFVVVDASNGAVLGMNWPICELVVTDFFDLIAYYNIQA